MVRVTAAVVLAFLLAAPAAAQRMSYGKAPMPGDTGPPAPENVGYDQRLGEKVPLDLEFYDHDGRSVRLRDLTGGKPTILVLAYYRCPKLCNQVLTGVLDSLKELRRADPAFVAGGPFNVVTVSIDPREAPGLARAKRQSYLHEYDGRGDDQPGWWFLTASHGQGTDVRDADRKIHELARAAGFRYTLRARQREYLYNPESGAWATADGSPLRDSPRDYDYSHASGILFLAPDGTITQYLLGINYDPAEVRTAVTNAAGGKVGTSFWRNVSQYCFVYDDVSGHYRPTMRLLAAVAVPFVLLVGFLAYRAVRKGLREKPIVVPTRAPATDLPAVEVDRI
jgi:protein SCO1/2